MTVSEEQNTKKWYYDSKQKALEENTNVEGGNIAIASGIYPNDNQTFKSHFPFAQTVRGNGACYMNAGLVAILNRCVGNQSAWEIFKKNLSKFGDEEIEKIIHEIENQARAENQQGLDRENLNLMLQLKEGKNPVMELVKRILIPKHQFLIKDNLNRIKKYEKFILENRSNPEKKSAIELHKVYIAECLENIALIESVQREKKFAEKYSETPLEDFLKELTMGMREGGKSFNFQTISSEFSIEDDLSIDQYSDLNTIYFFNQDANHFNIFYYKRDEVSKEISEITGITEDVESSTPITPNPHANTIIGDRAIFKPKVSQYFDSKNNIVEFISHSVYNDNCKFNYKKDLRKEKYDIQNYTKEREQEKIIKMLKEAKTQTTEAFSGSNLDDNFFLAVMKVASKNCGIGNINEIKFKEDFFKALQDLGVADKANYSSNPNLHHYAKYFSATFQRLSGDEGYLTGRDGTDGQINQTPRRLFRVCTAENIEKFRIEFQRDDLTTSASRRLGSPHPPSRQGQGR